MELTLFGIGVVLSIGIIFGIIVLVASSDGVHK